MSGWMTRHREQHLIRDAASGDREAAGALVQTHQQSVFAYILRMCGKRDLAEDVVQEAFVRVLTNLDRFDSRYRFSTWLFTIARRVLINHMEKRRPVYDSERVGAAAGKAPSCSPDIEAAEERVANRDAVQHALMGLSIEQREIVVLFHQHDWPIALIAEHLEMPEGTVKSHLHRGRTKMRMLLTELKTRDADSSAHTRASREEAWS